MILAWWSGLWSNLLLLQRLRSILKSALSNQHSATWHILSFVPILLQLSFSSIQYNKLTKSVVQTLPR